MAAESDPHISDSCMYCCPKCKGLFQSHDEHLKHQLSCVGNPFKSSSLYFACERKIFLQLYQSDDFPRDGYYNVQNMSKDDSFINHVVKIRLSQETFDPSIFLQSTASTTDPPGDDFLLERPDIDSLESDINKDIGYLESGKSTFPEEPVHREQIRGIINKNIEYLKSDPLANLPSDSSKQLPFEERLLSPIEKHFMHDMPKSRLGSPFEKNVNYLQDTNAPYQSSSFQYSSNQSIPYSCNLSTDLLSSLASTQDENQQSLQPSVEECPTLQYLDLAKKDPFLGQSQGLAQVNTKDPFLINATVRVEKPAVSNQKYPQSTKDDMHVTPTSPLQDINYFNFSSTLDEPTQLDYLDLATLDMLTNANIGSYDIETVKDKYNLEIDTHDMYSDTNLSHCDIGTAIGLDTEKLEKQNSSSYQNGANFSKTGVTEGGLDKKEKKSMPKRAKSCSNVNKKKGISNEKMDPVLEAVVERIRQRHEEKRKRPTGVKDDSSFMPSSTIKGPRKRKYSLNEDSSHDFGDRPKWRPDRKFNESQRLCQSNDILNIKKHLTGFTEEEMRSFNAVLGMNSITIKKQKTSSSKRAESSQFNKHDDVGDKQESSSNKLKTKTMKTSHGEKKRLLKCPKCDFHCLTVQELQGHCDRNCSLLKCQQCSFTCNNELTLNEHCSQHKYHVTLKCQQCSFICVKVSELISHMSIHRRTPMFRTIEQAADDTWCSDTSNTEYERMRTMLNEQRSVDDIDMYAYESLMAIRSSASDSELFVIEQKRLEPECKKATKVSKDTEPDPTTDFKFQRSLSLNDSGSLVRRPQVLLLNPVLPPVNESVMPIDPIVAGYEDTPVINDSSSLAKVEEPGRELTEAVGHSVVNIKSAQSMPDGTHTSVPSSSFINATLPLSVSTPPADSVVFPDELTVAVKSISFCNVPNSQKNSERDMSFVGDGTEHLHSTTVSVGETHTDISQMFMSHSREEKSSELSSQRQSDATVMLPRTVQNIAFEKDQLTPDDKCIVVFPELIDKQDIVCREELNGCDKSVECSDSSVLGLTQDMMNMNSLQNKADVKQSSIPFSETMLSFEGLNDHDNGNLDMYISDKVPASNCQRASGTDLVVLANDVPESNINDTTKVSYDGYTNTAVNQTTITSIREQSPGIRQDACKYIKCDDESSSYRFRPIKSDSCPETATANITNDEMFQKGVEREKSEDSDFVNLLTESGILIDENGTSLEGRMKCSDTPTEHLTIQADHFPNVVEESMSFHSRVSSVDANLGSDTVILGQKQNRNNSDNSQPIVSQFHQTEQTVPEICTADSTFETDKLNISLPKEEQVYSQYPYNEVPHNDQSSTDIVNVFHTLPQKSSFSSNGQGDNLIVKENVICHVKSEGDITIKIYPQQKSASRREYQPPGEIQEYHNNKVWLDNQMSTKALETHMPTEITAKEKIITDNDLFKEESTQFPEVDNQSSQAMKQDKYDKRKSGKTHLSVGCSQCEVHCESLYDLEEDQTHFQSCETLFPVQDEIESLQTSDTVESVDELETSTPMKCDYHESLSNNDFTPETVQCSQIDNVQEQESIRLCSQCGLTWSFRTEGTEHEKNRTSHNCDEMSVDESGGVHDHETNLDEELGVSDHEQQSSSAIVHNNKSVQVTNNHSNNKLPSPTDLHEENMIPIVDVADPKKGHGKQLTTQPKSSKSIKSQRKSKQRAIIVTAHLKPEKEQQEEIYESLTPNEIWVRAPKGKTLIQPTIKKKASSELVCHQCDFKTKFRCSLARHIARKHTGESKVTVPKQVTEYLCDEPGCEFRATVRKHLTTHEVEEHQSLRSQMCDTCGIFLPDFQSFQQHRRDEHRCERRYLCPKCHHHSSSRCDIISHYRRKHLRDEQYACNLCDYQTAYIQLLKFHLMAHAGIRPYKCSACDYHVNNMNKLTRHIKTRHKGENNVVCEKTDLTYRVDASQFRCKASVDIKDSDIRIMEVDISEVEALKEKEEALMAKQDKTDADGNMIQVKNDLSDDEEDGVSMRYIEFVRMPTRSESEEGYETVYQCSVCAYMMTSKYEIPIHRAQCEWQKII